MPARGVASGCPCCGVKCYYRRLFQMIRGSGGGLGAPPGRVPGCRSPQISKACSRRCLSNCAAFRPSGTRRKSSSNVGPVSTNSHSDRISTHRSVSSANSGCPARMTMTRIWALLTPVRCSRCSILDVRLLIGYSPSGACASTRAAPRAESAHAHSPRHTGWMLVIVPCSPATEPATVQHAGVRRRQAVHSQGWQSRRL
jgi:hypothetical protein